MNSPPLEVKVWGDWALFTRPEVKVERVSYPVPTPSAARGILEAIFWKPEFSYRIREIQVLAPIKYASVFRNEVSMVAGEGTEAISITDNRAQRHSLFLREVAYIFRADVVLKPGVDADPAKYRDQFRRRVDDGAFFHCPYAGCRECVLDFCRPTGRETPHPSLLGERDLGLMLFDIAQSKMGSIPLFFEASLTDGRLIVPDIMYERLEALK
jgi:CRISPR-associated protein Cas5d